MSMSDEYLRGWWDAKQQVFDALDAKFGDPVPVETGEFWRGMFRAEMLISMVVPRQVDGE